MSGEIKLYGRENSINVQKVLFTLEELKVKFVRIDAGLAHGVNDTEEYLRKYPNGKVPLLTVGEDFVLWESNVIVRYLYAKFGPERTVEEVAAQEKWHDWTSSYLAEPMKVIFWGLVRTPPEKRDVRVIQAAVDEITPQWRIIDKHLQAHPYMDGEQFSMADVPVACFLRRWLMLPIDGRPLLHNLNAYYDRLQLRQPFKSILRIPIT